MKTIDTYYFLGIGGIGMSALARYMVLQGMRVLGYDRTRTALTEQLEREGIWVQYDESVDALQTLSVDSTLVVRTPAVPEDMAVYQWFIEHEYCIIKRAELLGQVTREKKALCVAGTHGKTTTSTMLAHLLCQSHVGTNAFLGGIANNYGSNLLADAVSDLVVVEADEFDRSFHQLLPYISIITSVDADHLDIYGTEEAYRESFQHYASLVQHALVVKKGLELNLESSKAKVYTYAVMEEADFYADDVRVEEGRICFNFHTPTSVVTDVELGVPAWVNIENGVAAMAVAWLMGATTEELKTGMRSFSGVYRRFNQHINTPSLAYIDDYAHHPAELQATIQSVRRLYPDRYLIGVFQPHLFTRTRDFVDGFAQTLSQLDEVVLLPIYPAREEPIEGITSEWLMHQVQAKRVLVLRAVLAKFLRERTKNLIGKGSPCVVLTMGAGDIGELVEEIKQILK